MSTILTVNDDIRKEFVVDEDGKVYAKSIRAVARICAKDDSYVRRWLKRIKECGREDLPPHLKPFAGMDFIDDKSQGSAAVIPDILVGALLAMTAVNEPDNEEAQTNNVVMNGVGIRCYFQRELGWTTPDLTKIPSHAQALRGWADAIDRAEKAEKLIEDLTPKADAYDIFLNSHSNMDWIEAANVLAATDAKGRNIGRTKLLDFLRNKKVIQQKDPIPYATHSTKGWFNTHKKPRKHDPNKFDTVTLVTPLGLTHIADMLRKEGFNLNSNIPTPKAYKLTTV